MDPTGEARPFTTARALAWVGWVFAGGGVGSALLRMPSQARIAGVMHEARTLMKKVLKAEMMKREKFRKRQKMSSGLLKGDALGDPVKLMREYLDALKSSDFNEEGLADIKERMRQAADQKEKDAKKTLQAKIVEKSQKKNMIARVEVRLNELNRKSRSGG